MADKPKRIKTWPGSNPETATVGTSPVEILKANQNRISFLIVNLSTNNGYVGFDSDVSASKGIPLASGGGVVSALYREDGDLVTSSVWGVNLVGSGTWYILEVVASDLEEWIRFTVTPIGG